MKGWNSYYYTDGGSGIWFQEYQGEEIVIFDDFRVQVFNSRWFIWLAGITDIRVPVKNSSVKFTPKIIIFTNPSHWKDLFEMDPNLDGSIDQIMKRVNLTYHFTTQLGEMLEEEKSIIYSRRLSIIDEQLEEIDNAPNFNDKHKEFVEEFMAQTNNLEEDQQLPEQRLESLTPSIPSEIRNLKAGFFDSLGPDGVSILIDPEREREEGEKTENNENKVSRFLDTESDFDEPTKIRYLNNDDFESFDDSLINEGTIVILNKGSNDDNQNTDLNEPHVTNESQRDLN
jgi:hypothetical protein